MIEVLQQAAQLAFTTLVYIGAFLCYYVGQLSIGSCPLLRGNAIAQVHLYSLAKQLLLWDEPHYRAATFADDLRANLKNVAIPGTGVPLSVFCYSRAMALLFVLLVNPAACLAAACYLTFHRLSACSPCNDSSSAGGHAKLVETYRQLLLAPQHWFVIWRANCVLAGWHALLTGSASYSLEDKGAFLLQGQRLGLPVSPFYQQPTVFVKHRSIEGGMGIHVFENFAAGGDWIIQPALSNSAALAALLPRGAPLSTLRVVTASTAWLQDQAGQQGGLQDDFAQLQQEHSSRSGGRPRPFGGQCRQRQRSLSELATQDLQQAPDDSSALRQRQQQSGADASGDGAGSSGDGEPQAQVRISTSAPGPEARSRPLSAGFLEHVESEGRLGRHEGAVSSCRQHGLADPALLPSGRCCSSGRALQPLLPSNGVCGSQHQQLPQQQDLQLQNRLPHSKALAPAASQQGLTQQQQQDTEQLLPSSPAAVSGDDTAGSSTQQAQQGSGPGRACVEVVTAVWRAGLAGASTDHSSICFNVDLHTGELSPGVTANHWYRLGLTGLGRVAAAARQVWQSHPDTGKQVAGCVVPGMADVLQAVVAAHTAACRDLPLVGWDVALTTEGVFILEVNLSCNLFNGALDSSSYYSLLWHYFDKLSVVDRFVSGVRKCNNKSKGM